MPARATGFRRYFLLFSLTLLCGVGYAANGDAPAVIEPAAVPMASAATAAKSGNPLDYRLAPGDVLLVEVFGHPDLTVTVPVPISGRAPFPLIGDVDGLLGRGQADLAAELRARLQDGYLTEAIVTITIKEFGPRIAYVMGSVQRPEAIKLNPFVPLTALQAVSSAGGFLPEANRSAALVIRDDATHPTLKQALPVPSSDSPDAISADVVLQPGDFVIVPRLDRVFIIGQVKIPGAINLPSHERLTVSKAISIAGGFDRFGRQDSVQVVRNGAASVVVDVKAVLEGKKADDVELKPGDTVYVPEARF